LPCGPRPGWFLGVTSVRNAVDEAAQRLAEAVKSRRPCAPVRDVLGRHDVAQAYRVQERGIDDRVARGARRIGRKIGLTSPAIQAQLGVDQPDVGTLLDDMQVQPGSAVAAERLLQPRIEAEVAFVLGADIAHENPTLEEVRAAIRSTHAALEIVDSRISGWDITITDTVADNASSGLFVLGEAAVQLDRLRPVDVTMEMRRNGEVVSTGSGAACLGDPLIAVQWLARTATALGRPLQAGEVILSGALGPMVSVTPGEIYTARISGLGEVQARFAAAEGGARA
jgi:2-keto-4-pentenoate hydratase